MANKDLAVHAVVSVEGRAEVTCHSETAGVGAVMHLTAWAPALVGAAVPDTWESGPDRAPEE